MYVVSTVVICSNFTTFAVESPMHRKALWQQDGCDLLKFHYLCGRITNNFATDKSKNGVVICSNFTTFAVESPITKKVYVQNYGCDLLKFHYLCGRITNLRVELMERWQL